MKYKKEWQEHLNTLPLWYQNRCISYKKWKKRLPKYSDVDKLLVKLIHQVKNVEYIFQYCTRDQNILLSMCFGKNDTATLDFARLNAQTVRKLCKKLDKRYSVVKFTSWFQDCKQMYQYSFLGGNKITTLEIQTKQFDVVECPICFGSWHKICILRCGHVLCDQCLRNILHCDSSSTIIQAQEKNGSDTVCHVCREGKAFNQIICVDP